LRRCHATESPANPAPRTAYRRGRRPCPPASEDEAAAATVRLDWRVRLRNRRDGGEGQGGGGGMASGCLGLWASGESERRRLLLLELLLLLRREERSWCCPGEERAPASTPRARIFPGAVARMGRSVLGFPVMFWIMRPR
jgi:hypothetical protein